MKSPRRHDWILAAMSAACALAVCLLYSAGFAPLLKSELYTQDLHARLGRKTAVDSRLVFIGIDRAAYRDIPLALDEEARQSSALQALRESFPWPRTVWAELIERLAKAGAKVIVIDLLFAAPGPGDEELRQALERHRDKVVIGSNFSDAQDSGITQTLPSSSILNTAHGASASFDPCVGYVNIWPDWDGVVRRARYRLSDASLYEMMGAKGLAGDVKQYHEALAARALRKFGRPGAIPPGEQPRLFRFSAPPGEGYRPHPLNEIFSPRIWAANYQNGAFFRDKIVVVGPSANFFHDEHATPLQTSSKTQMLGPEIHLNIIGAGLHSEFLYETSRAANFILIGIAGVLAALLCLLIRQPVQRLIVIAFLSVGYWFGNQWLFDHANLVVLAVCPMLVLTWSGVSTLGYDFFTEQIERARVRKTFERYVSKNVVKELLDNPQSYLTMLGGQRRPVTVLFSDLRDFTTLTEGANETQLVQQLNEYFTEMVRLVFENHGTLDKFIGDAVMGVWGNLVSRGTARDAQDALTTAWQMRSSLARLNEGWKTRGWPILSLGIGINQGEAIVGNLGSIDKMELTVIGDAVNLASRLETLTKEYRLDLLIGETVATLVRERFILRTVDLNQVKGRSRPVESFTVLGERSSTKHADEPWLSAYETGLGLYRSQKFVEAARSFEEVLRHRPDDFLATLYLQRCRNMQGHPPGDGWNGVYPLRPR